MGQLEEEIGILHQDRSSGVLGIMNDARVEKNSPYIPVTLNWKSPLYDKKFYFEVLDDRSFTAPLMESIVNAVFFSYDGFGKPATTFYSLKAHLSRKNSEKPSSENYQNIIMVSNQVSFPNNQHNIMYLVSHIQEIMNIVKNNFQESASITNLTINIETIPSYNYIYLTSVKKEKEIYHPGENLDFQLVFKRYRQSDWVKKIRYQIPHNLKPGEHTIAVSAAELPWIINFLFDDPNQVQFSNLDSMIRFVSSKPLRNKLSVWLIEGREVLKIKDQAYHHLPANQKKLLMESLHSEKKSSVHVLHQDYHLPQNINGFLTFKINVQPQNYKDF